MDYLVPLLVMRDDANYTVTLAAQFFMSSTYQSPIDVARIYAVMILLALPSIRLLVQPEIPRRRYYCRFRERMTVLENLEQYRNPVPFRDGKRHTNPDPFVLRWCGKWYCYATDAFGVKVSLSDDLVHWQYKGYAIQDDGYRNYWAPSVIYQNGTFYMYYSNVPASVDDCHEEHLKLAVSNNPLGPFIWKKTFFEEFSIDSHPLVWNGRLYLFYSVNNWLGTESKVAGTCIVVDELTTPEELAGHPHSVVLPSLRQEIYEENRFGDGRDWYTIEGAAPVVHGNQFWLLYSANAYLNEDYFIGTAVASCKPELMDMVWDKYPNPFTWHPLLKKSATVEGTGHNTVTKAPNMVDDWIVYHGRRMDEARDPSLEQREMYIDPLWFNGRELLCFGPTADGQAAPGKPQFQVQNLDIHDQTLFPFDSACYRAEFWISACRQHTGARYGIYLSYQDERNYLELHLHTGKNEAQIICCVDGICQIILREALEKHYDYTVPHLIQLSRCFDEYSVCLDEGIPLYFNDVGSHRRRGKLGVVPYFTSLTLYSFTATECAELHGTGLWHMGQFYDVQSGRIDETGCLFVNGRLRARIPFSSFTEEFQLIPDFPENLVAFTRKCTEDISVKNKRTPFSVYHIVRGNQERFLIDGVESEWRNLEDQENNWTLDLNNVKISLYHLTKN